MYRLQKHGKNPMTAYRKIIRRMRRFLPFILYLLSFVLIYPQSYQELQKLQSEYKKALERQALQKPADISDAEKIAKSTALPDKLIYSRKDVESLLANTGKLLEQLKFFKDSTIKMPYIGYDIFTKRDTIPFWQNLPIPSDYKLGPGDEIIISLWGETESYETAVINRDGEIFINNIGVLNVSGKSVSDAKSYILTRYSKVYSTLISKTPKSFIDISLGELKSVNVHFVGFVKIPGVHMIHPFSNVFTGLIQSGGVDVMGSLRDIQVFRSGHAIGNVDLYGYLFLGKSINDIRLQDQDVIFIPPRVSKVALTGRIKKPGYYEIKKNETMDFLFDISGGTDTRSSSSIFLYRNNNSSGERNSDFLLNLSEFDSFKVLDGDSIYVPLKPEKNIFVKIDGQIKNSGKYPYHLNMKIQDLINATMSMDDLDFSKTLDLSRIIIYRKNPSGSRPLSIFVNMETDNIPLKNGDHIIIPKLDLLQPIESVKFTGEIKTPGIHPVNNLTTLAEALDLAGGYTSRALKNGIEVFRDSMKIAWKDDSFILNEGDSLNVLKKSGLVLIKGEVNVPGFVSYKKGDSIKKYIKRAGGYSAFAELRDVLVIHPNGTAIPKLKWSSPKVLEGSTIIVNQRTLSGSSRGVTGWQAFSMISAQAGNVATTLLTLILLMNQSSSPSG